MAGRGTGTEPDAGGIASFIAERAITVGNYIKNAPLIEENMSLVFSTRRFRGQSLSFESLALPHPRNLTPRLNLVSDAANASQLAVDLQEP
jgi:hypothetical protein